jgi:predicted nucleic acid-binding protein
VIVVDASALAAFILKEPGWRSLVEYVRYCLSLDHAVKEVANALWKLNRVKKVISVEDALRLFNMLSSLLNVNIILEPEQLYLSKAFRIALDYGLTVYDALYIALAKEKKLPLLTLDERQREAALNFGVETIGVAL